MRLLCFRTTSFSYGLSIQIYYFHYWQCELYISNIYTYNTHCTENEKNIKQQENRNVKEQHYEETIEDEDTERDWRKKKKEQQSNHWINEHNFHSNQIKKIEQKWPKNGRKKAINLCTSTCIEEANYDKEMLIRFEFHSWTAQKPIDNCPFLLIIPTWNCSSHLFCNSMYLGFWVFAR